MEESFPFIPKVITLLVVQRYLYAGTVITLVVAGLLTPSCTTHFSLSSTPLKMPAPLQYGSCLTDPIFLPTQKGCLTFSAKHGWGNAMVHWEVVAV